MTVGRPRKGAPGRPKRKVQHEEPPSAAESSSSESPSSVEDKRESVAESEDAEMDMEVKHDSEVQALDWRPGNNHPSLLASLSRSGTVYLYSPSSSSSVTLAPQIVPSTRVGLAEAAVAWSPDGELLLVNHSHGGFGVWDGRGRLIARMDYTGGFRCPRWSTDSTKFSLINQTSVSLYSKDIRVLHSLEICSAPVEIMDTCWLDNEYMAIGISDARIILCRVGTESEKVRDVHTSLRILWKLATSSSGGLLAAGGEAGVNIYSTAVRGDLQLIHQLRDNLEMITELAWFGDFRLATGGSDKHARVWDINKGNELCCFENDAEVTGLAWLDDVRLVCGSEAGSVAVWSLESQNRVAEYSLPGPLTELSITEDKSVVLIGMATNKSSQLRVSNVPKLPPTKSLSN